MSSSVLDCYKMPFAKKKGRPKGKVSYGYLSKEEKAEYHHLAVDKYRRRSSLVCSTLKNTHNSKRTTSNSSLPNEVDRLSPQSPNTRKRKKLESQQKLRKRLRISKMRRMLAEKMWTSRIEIGSTSESESESENESEMSRASNFRLKARLRGYLPVKPIDSLKMINYFLTK